MISLSAQLPSSYPGRVPVSAISASKAASHSQEGSPIMNKDPYPYNFQLPESILSRKTSNDLLDRSLASYNPSAMPEASPKSSSLIRRFLNRAHRFTSIRQQSSAAPASQNRSISPSILRYRSDNNTTAPPWPPEYNAVTNMDEEANPVPDGNISLFGLDGATYSSSNNNAAGLINGSGSAKAGPVLPASFGMVVKFSRCLGEVTRDGLILYIRPNPISSRGTLLAHISPYTSMRSKRSELVLILNNTALILGISELYADTWTKLLHIITDNEEVLNRWTGFLEAILTYRHGQYWQTKMAREFNNQPRDPKQEELDITGVKRVCQNLHIYSSQWTLQTNFGLSDVRRREKLNFTEFKGFIHLIKQRHDIQRIIRSIAAKPKTGITFPEFLAFLRDTQGEDIDSNLSI
ncbi:hypothetical protein B0J15DRAFT_565195 [Fusarium solani]|uniref:Uncharacterized protein n=1 Tax=Fusarium solani TaxID=169388 RepID=A0A9P9GR79_FUSSL|nr:uncharacterized protein B0J15DRAFT_565195 [Fusarium solani]KAH7243841.1 hypothetical protein B0J15DRAFT_565195 [Fusarium solani]